MTNAMDRLRDEMAAQHEDGMLCQLGEMLTEYLRTQPETEEAFAAEGKTIAGAVEAMAKEARKKAKNGLAALTAVEGLEIALKYYGVEPDKGAAQSAVLRALTGAQGADAPQAGPEPAAADDLDLDALLGGGGV